VIDDPAFAALTQAIVAPAGAAAAAETMAPEDSSVVTAPMTLAAATGTSEPLDIRTSSAEVAVPGSSRSTAPVSDLPDAWFAPRAAQENARSVAAAWQRIVRDLPAHLVRGDAWDGAPPFANGVRVNPADSIGVRVNFDNAVGLSDAAAGRLRPLEGLREGFALLT
jgi:hypothetical protein